jgi:CDP-diacylglycerol pyrophosphatase
MKKKTLFLVITLMVMVIFTTALTGAAPSDNSDQDEGVKIIRTYFNVSIIINDHTEAQNILCDLVKQYSGTLTFSFADL